MFEDSTFESGSRIKTKSRRWMIFTGTLNGVVLVLLILVPLFDPEALPSTSMLTVLTVPPPPPQPPPQPPEARVTRAPSEMMNSQLTAPPRIPKGIVMVDRKEPPLPSFSDVANANLGGADVTGVFGDTAVRGPKVQAQPLKRLNISSGVAAGMLIRKTIPVYPLIAIAARVSGTVVLQATIGKNGRIEDLHVISGPPMLQGAALDAVRAWLYRPYLLNGEPVGVQTTINVTFTLGG